MPSWLATPLGYQPYLLSYWQELPLSAFIYYPDKIQAFFIKKPASPPVAMNAKMMVVLDTLLVKEGDTVHLLFINQLVKFSINDQIHICKDCEFRHICTDCRAYIEDPDDIYSKPLKCGYNPYTGEWAEWSTNPLKQKAIQYYGMEELMEQREQR